MRFKYKPGLYPTPMLAYYDNVNLELFNQFSNKNQKFVDNYKHMWNSGGYIIVNDQNEVVASSYDQFIYVVYLLRVLNKEVIITLKNEDTIEEINKHLMQEFKKI